MFESFDEWRAVQIEAMANHVALVQQRDELDARIAESLGRVVSAYQWPDVPEPSRFDGFRVTHIDEQAYAEDLAAELAIVNKTSQISARNLIGDTAALINNLPQCWNKITTSEAPLWQGRRVAQQCAHLPEHLWPQIDDAVALAMGQVGAGRFFKTVDAVIKVANTQTEVPEPIRPQRFVRTRGDHDDPDTGWLTARLDRADVIFWDAMIQLGADQLAAGHTNSDVTDDERRATAFGIMANPAAAVAWLGVPTTRGMDQKPETDADKAAFIRRAKKLVHKFAPRTQVYVHMFAGAFGDPDMLARVEGIGPILASQVARITQSTKVRVTPAIHLDSTTIAVDQYEIPARIRERVLLVSNHEVFPWSSTESRHLDLDHTIPYRPGVKGLTSTDNLGALSRRAHRVKTHASWQLTQPKPGTYIWQTPAGQAIQVDNQGTRRLRSPT